MRQYRILWGATCMAVFVGLSGCTLINESVDAMNGGGANSDQAKTVKKLPSWRVVEGLHGFDRVEVSGATHVEITPSKGDQAHVVMHTKRDVSVKVLGRTLYVHRDTNTISDQKMDLKIKMPVLAGLHVKDAGLVTVKNVKGADGMLIVDDSVAPVKLKGHYAIAKITKNGRGPLEVLWVDAKKLNIESNQGVVEVAGKVDHLYIRARGSALINAKDLRANDVWVDAKQTSVTNIRPMDELHVYGQDYARVFYFHRPSPKRLIVKTKDYAAAEFVR